MHKSIAIAAFLAAALSATDSSAVEDLENRKYCGSGFTEKLVPDAPFGCDMSQACKSHDACYSKCDKGGSLYGQPYCLNSKFSLVRQNAKIACEKQFYADIDRNNKGRWACKGLGGVYVAAVAVLGQGPFNGKKLPLAEMADLVLTSNDVTEIGTKMNAMATLSQRGLIDLQKPKRIGDQLIFDQLLKDGQLVAPKIYFNKGAQRNELKKIQGLGVAK